MIADRAELLRLEEPGAHVVLFEHRNKRLREHLATLHRERERPFQCGELAVALGIRGAVLLARGDVAPDVRGGDRDHTPAPEKRLLWWY